MNMACDDFLIALYTANLDEREGAMDLLRDYQYLPVLGDKGFLDQGRQESLAEERGVILYKSQSSLFEHGTIHIKR